MVIETKKIGVSPNWSWFKWHVFPWKYQRSYTREWLTSSTKESYWQGLRKTDSDIENTCITISPLIALPFLRGKWIYFIASFYGKGNLHLKLTSLLEILISNMALCFHCVKYDTSLTRIFSYKDKIVNLPSYSPGACGEGKPYHFWKVVHEVFLLHLFLINVNEMKM